ncbi:MAG: asparagine synthase (glutamine-hydrolyzing) [Gemmatimonadota bacterium]|nr:asparagine synthase (glutamine-hydrolyzing) [Gemmatimonadota bacterium]MDH3478409.1 asparagine synthase (glutamine-hydrolyzing) [Gemmatimonadota bacterium]MDH3568770.1 asparagine synthase (glutamine-hydrolyzing) [Gemmatimonadota bacterium]MDH5549371.1 asparagine synthase (glutamine-hydrolyzing) [Gemmatimonadota bacterium]
MCGIYGMVALGGAPLVNPGAMETMGHLLRHRGPHDHGLQRSDRAALGTERLRITDPRPEAAQPFTDPEGKLWVSCNGAIYNAAELRARFADYPYRSRSDVEPLVPLLLAHGIDAIAELDGMFAIAIWDDRRNQLTLARDRSGEKPLFYARVQSELWFASELRPLLTTRTERPTVDREALHDYIRLGYACAPRTLIAGITSLEPGTTMTVGREGLAVRKYWNPEAVVTMPLSVDEAERRLQELLESAVCRQVSADVPVGVFTSGGVDSALLAALAARATPTRQLHSFTVGFADASFDERAPAANVAALVRSRHHTIVVDEATLARAFDALIERLAEPIADPAFLPTYLLARAARQHVGVVLSGEGADELFGGYPTYLGHRFADRYAALPRPLRRLATFAVDALPTSPRKVTLEFLLKRFVHHAAAEPHDRHSAWFGTGLPSAIFPGADRADRPPAWDAGTDVLRGVMLRDYLTYLPDNLLTKVDRATMQWGLEARSPYLDRDLVWFALGLSTELKVRGLETKWLLKRVADRFLPTSLVRRRKRGLSVPIAGWINRGLRVETDRVLQRDRLEAAGLFDGSLVARLLAEHRTGQADHGRALWPLIVFERWRERWLGET